jgi:hypothetical protein
VATKCFCTVSGQASTATAFFHQFRYLIALETFPVMSGNYAAAARTTIFPVLCLDKCRHSLLLDEFQIVYHAHCIIISVSLIKVPELPAGILAAFKTKCDVSFCDVLVSRTVFV